MNHFSARVLGLLIGREGDGKDFAAGFFVGE
jgi:hypothetical protein